MADENDDPTAELVSREPTLRDLVALCRELNEQGARYVIVGGFAIRTAGVIRDQRSRLQNSLITRANASGCSSGIWWPAFGRI